MRKLREEDGVASDVEMDDEAGWENWEAESDGSESSSDDGEWMNVSDDDKDIVFSDSDDEKEKEAPKENPEDRISAMATTKVLSHRLSSEIYF